jgi:hemerythrin-like domain-containing protein
MPHPSIQKIRQEHTTIASLLASLVMMVQRGPKDDYERFFDVMRAMLFYLDEFPAKYHHPKEDTYLLVPLKNKTDAHDAVLKRLSEDHIREESRVRELQHMLHAWEYLGEERRQEFEVELIKYANFYREHMRIEETEIIPAALECLSREEWQELDRQFQVNSFTINAAEHPNPAFNRLFTKIVNFAPAPIGLGRSD